MAWGPMQWIKEMPYANAAQQYSFQPGEKGHYVLEFWITPFDYAGAEGPQRAVESKLTENKIIGMSYALIDYDDWHSGDTNNGFWNLSRHHTMYGNADYLCLFQLMPLAAASRPALVADWSWQLLDAGRREVAFHDDSTGTVTNWHWDFGDGSTSADANPIHRYQNPDHYVVILDIAGPAGRARRSKVWDVTVK